MFLGCEEPLFCAGKSLLRSPNILVDPRSPPALHVKIWRDGAGAGAAIHEMERGNATLLQPTREIKLSHIYKNRSVVQRVI